MSALTLKQDRASGEILDADAQDDTNNNIYNINGNHLNGDLDGLWSNATNSTQHPTGYTLATFDDATPTENSDYLTLAVEDTSDALDLSQVSAGVFEKAIENVVFLRAQTGGGMTRLNFALDSISSQEPT